VLLEISNEQFFDGTQILTQRSLETMVFSNKKSKNMEKEKFGTLHEFACHPCAGAMLIFSVSFQF